MDSFFGKNSTSNYSRNTISKPYARDSSKITFPSNFSTEKKNFFKNQDASEEKLSSSFSRRVFNNETINIESDAKLKLSPRISQRENVIKKSKQDITTKKEKDENMMSTQFLDNTILESKNPKLHAATAYMERILNFKEEKLRESYEAYLNFIKKGLNFDIAINGKLLSLLAKFNRGTEINNIFKKMQKVDIKCVKIVLNYYTRRRDPEYSMKLFNSLPEMGLTPNQHIYYELIRVFANVKDEKQMLHYFNEIKNSLKEEPAIFNYNTVLNFYRENGNYDQIFKFFDDLKKSKVVTPNSYTYAVILNACFDNKKHLLAEK
ncbi:hypothetical protein HK099_000699, partial [Clydaea vesicula]